MNFKIYKRPEQMPLCSYCGYPMDYWSPYMETYEHNHCSAKRIANAMLSAK